LSRKDFALLSAEEEEEEEEAMLRELEREVRARRAEREMERERTHQPSARGNEMDRRKPRLPLRDGRDDSVARPLREDLWRMHNGGAGDTDASEEAAGESLRADWRSVKSYPSSWRWPASRGRDGQDDVDARLAELMEKYLGGEEESHHDLSRNSTKPVLRRKVLEAVLKKTHASRKGAPGKKSAQADERKRTEKVCV
jgi:hypothetical protein